MRRLMRLTFQPRGRNISNYMKLARTCKNLAPIFVFMALFTGCEQETNRSMGIGASSESLIIGRMRASIWPEHDDPSLLVIYDGRFEDVSSYPVKTSFFIPKGSVISDACSLSHAGQHFCQLYKTIAHEDFDEISLTLPYPNFYLSFHTPGFDLQNEQRSFDYRIRANHHIKAMEVDIQQPLRSSGFKITPAEGAVLLQPDEASISQVKGFTHFAYILNDIKAGQQPRFGMNYIKQDPKPSVDIKYVSMKEPTSWESPYEAQKKIRTYIYIVFAAGTLIALALLLRLFYSRRAKQPGSSS